MKLLIKRILSYFPTPLPVGMTQFNTWADDVIALSGEYADRTSMLFALANMVIHAPSHKGALSKQYFVIRLRKSAANQVASQVFQDVKAEQDARIKAASEAVQLKQAEATAAETTLSGQSETN